jgi:hypothetical protein
MFLLDSLLIGSLRFVLDKVVVAAESELNNEDTLRHELLTAEMRLEQGEIDEEEFAVIEGDVLARLREIQERKRGEAAAAGEGTRVTGAEVEFLE